MPANKNTHTAVVPQPQLQPQPPATTTSVKAKKKNKKTNNKLKANASANANMNGPAVGPGDNHKNDHGDGETAPASDPGHSDADQDSLNGTNAAADNTDHDDDGRGDGDGDNADDEDHAVSAASIQIFSAIPAGASAPAPAITPIPTSSVAPPTPAADSATGPNPAADERFNALVRDRDSLRAEVTELRRSLEEVRSRHAGEADERETLRRSLTETRGEKDHAEMRYRDLLGKVNTIKSQLGERLRADADDLEQSRVRIEELEDENARMQIEADEGSRTIAALKCESQEQAKELASLRSRTNLSQQNWMREREELLEHEEYLKAEFEEAKQAMHNWEILAMEERAVRESLAEKAMDVEEQLAAAKEDYGKAILDRDSLGVTVDGLQQALQDIQTARRQELREIVESSEAQVEDFKKKLQTADAAASEARGRLQTAEKELQRVLPFEKEVREKNLLIGKLRHEAVTLNEHLTKALKFLKRGKMEDNVDRHLVTNYLLQFLTLERSDPKKFQVLQLISALLGWTDEEQEQAGLARPGASSGNSGGSSLRLPGSSSPLFRSTSSSGAVTAGSNSSGGRYDPAQTSSMPKESLAELWSSFLEQEAEQAQHQAHGRVVKSPVGSRRPSGVMSRSPHV